MKKVIHKTGNHLGMKRVGGVLTSVQWTRGSVDQTRVECKFYVVNREEGKHFPNDRWTNSTD
jgi:hypothetical protein